MVIKAAMIVLSIFMLMGVGMLLTHVKWIDKSGAQLLARLTVNVGMPALVVNNMLTSFTRDQLAQSMNGILVAFVSMAVSLALGLLVAKLIKIPRDRRGVFTCMFGFSNSVFVGLPVTVALYGEEVTPIALIYYIVNTFLFWSVGNQMMARDAGKKMKMDLKKLLPAPLIAFLLSLLLVLLGIRLPDFLMDGSKYLGNMVTPLSLIYTGYVVMRMIQSRQLRWQKGYTAVILGRFVLGPLLLFATTLVIPLPGLMRSALMVQASMPVMAQCPITAGSLGVDREYAAGGVGLTAVLSLAALPALMSVMALLP